MSDQEAAIVRAFNAYFEKAGIFALAYRLKQHRFSAQILDLVSDSRDRDYYLGIECKSVDPESTSALYFSQHFHQATPDTPDNQVDNISHWLQQTGRTGWLAVELHRGVGKPKECHFIPWGAVTARFKAREKGFSFDEIQRWPGVQRKGRDYLLTEEFFQKVRRL